MAGTYVGVNTFRDDEARAEDRGRGERGEDRGRGEDRAEDRGRGRGEERGRNRPPEDRGTFTGPTRSGHDLVTARKFSGEEYEDANDFIELIDISYSTVDNTGLTNEMIEKTKVLYLSGNLRGDAHQWWSMLEIDKRNTWAKAVTALRGKYANEGQKGSKALIEWHKAHNDFLRLRQNGSVDSLLLCLNLGKVDLTSVPRCLSVPGTSRVCLSVQSQMPQLLCTY